MRFHSWNAPKRWYNICSVKTKYVIGDGSSYIDSDCMRKWSRNSEQKKTISFYGVWQALETANNSNSLETKNEKRKKGNDISQRQYDLNSGGWMVGVNCCSLSQTRNVWSRFLFEIYSRHTHTHTWQRNFIFFAFYHMAVNQPGVAIWQRRRKKVLFADFKYLESRSYNAKRNRAKTKMSSSRWLGLMLHLLMASTLSTRWRNMKMRSRWRNMTFLAHAFVVVISHTSQLLKFSPRARNESKSIWNWATFKLIEISTLHHINH